MSQEQTRPWWREPMVCMVIAGPALVVIASFATLGLALRYPDPPLSTTTLAHVRAAEDDADTAQQANEIAAQLPAVAARNHAATGGH